MSARSDRQQARLGLLPVPIHAGDEAVPDRDVDLVVERAAGIAPQRFLEDAGHDRALGHDVAHAVRREGLAEVLALGRRHGCSATGAGDGRGKDDRVEHAHFNVLLHASVAARAEAVKGGTCRG